jgi:hypothetical protein
MSETKTSVVGHRPHVWAKNRDICSQCGMTRARYIENLDDPPDNGVHHCNGRPFNALEDR